MPNKEIFLILIYQLNMLSSFEPLVKCLKELEQGGETTHFVFKIYILMIQAFKSNPVFLKELDYENIDDFFLEFLLFTSLIENVKIPNVEAVKEVVLDLNMVLKTDLLYENRNQKRFKLF